MYKEAIGIVGGFGGFATLNFFKRILEEFASECERNYPHIYMDNDFTMPSRTRSLLTGEQHEVIVNAIAASIRKLIYLGGDSNVHIILPCGTSHAFLKDVYKLVPEAEEHIINIIETAGKRLNTMSVNEVLIIAAEGTLKHDIYAKAFEKYNIKCITPDAAYYSEIRYFIEAVKRNILSDEVSDRFLKFLETFQVENIVLGCTEFPVLIDYLHKSNFIESIRSKYNFYDPLEITIEELKHILK